MTSIEKIHSLDKFGSRPGLDRISKFLDILGNPQDKLKFIHVAEPTERVLFADCSAVY